MLFSIALIFIFGIALSEILQKLKIPGLLGMLITGIILGPYCLNLIVPEILNISKDLREIALIVVLFRAGLSLDMKDLKKVGRPAILLSFIPATIEILVITLLSPLIFQIGYIEAAIMGSVVAAVSPAVVVPRMLKLMESGYGKNKRIPQLIMAGASVDDIYVIVLFTAFIGIAKGDKFSSFNILSVPISIVTGLLVGIFAGVILTRIFKKIHMRDTVKTLIIFSTAFLIITLESFASGYVPLSGLLAIMAMGVTILKKYEILAKRLSGKFSKLWVGSEIVLFVLVGAAVNIHYLKNAGFFAIMLILTAIIFRIFGVFLSLIKTPLNIKEKIFCSIAYLPKATVQAAIGGIPLAMGIPSGETILTVAVLAIIITAPLGAIGIDMSYKKLLINDN